MRRFLVGERTPRFFGRGEVWELRDGEFQRFRGAAHGLQPLIDDEMLAVPEIVSALALRMADRILLDEEPLYSKLLQPPRRCGDCGASISLPHRRPCGVERCSVCSGLRIDCDCRDHDVLRARWSGWAPGEIECVILDWMLPGAKPDIERWHAFATANRPPVAEQSEARAGEEPNAMRLAAVLEAVRRIDPDRFGIGSSSVAFALGLDQADVEAALADLAERGALHRTGQGDDARWKTFAPSTIGSRDKKSTDRPSRPSRLRLVESRAVVLERVREMDRSHPGVWVSRNSVSTTFGAPTNRIEVELAALAASGMLERRITRTCTECGSTYGGTGTPECIEHGDVEHDECTLYRLAKETTC